MTCIFVVIRIMAKAGRRDDFQIVGRPDRIRENIIVIAINALVGFLFFFTELLKVAAHFGDAFFVKDIREKLL